MYRRSLTLFCLGLGVIVNSGCAGLTRNLFSPPSFVQPCNLSLPARPPLPPYGQPIPFQCLHEYRDPADSTNVRVIFYYQPVYGMDYRSDGAPLKFFPLKYRCFYDRNLPPNTFAWFQQAGAVTDWPVITVYFNAKSDKDHPLIHPPTKDWLKTFARVQ